MSSKESLPYPAPPASLDAQDDAVEAHYSCLERPCACMDGLVYLTYVVYDEETGEEVERVEAVPCRHCAEEAR